jgi:acyl carrier protein
MNNVKAIVCGALAEHVGLNPSAVQPWHDLDRDLDVTQLELALIGLEIEDALGVELPAEGFAPLETVNDLCVFVARTVAVKRRHEILDSAA